MLDLKQLRRNPSDIEEKLKSKDASVSLKEILAIDEEVRALKTEVETLKSAKNLSAKQVGEKKRKGEDASELLAEIQGVKEKIDAIDHKLKDLEKDLQNRLAYLPNIPMDEVKRSLDPKDNVCIKTVGEKPTFDFPFKNHVELNEKLGLFDFKRSAKTTGNRWPLYTGLGARLEWALINYMLDVHLKKGYTQWIPPLLVRPDMMYGSGQLPKFKEQLFKIQDNDYDLYLIPTAEAVLNGIHYEEIFKTIELPKKYVAFTPCFRREAGAAGTQERGLIRTHQFNKVEMFCFTKPDESEKVFDEMVESAEEILSGLNLHYRNMLLVTGDTSFPAAKTIDIEVFLPGQDRYYEVSSISNCTDFQARRSHIRHKKGDEKPEFVHTLNGSGLATSRLMVALLENNQQKDGSIHVPEVLQPYLHKPILSLTTN